MDKDFAVVHLPNQPLADDLPNLHRVTFANIDIGKWYYMSDTEVEFDSLVQGVYVDDDPNFKFVRIVWSQPRDLNFPWQENRDLFILCISDNQVDNETFKFYVYAEPQNNNVVMNGGRIQQHKSRRTKRSCRIKRRKTYRRN